MPHPAIILVRPQMGENIGAAARAMMNFGLSELRLVAPRDGWPNPKAHEMAAHADSIIEHATVYATLADALADVQYAVASSARLRGMPIPGLTPRECAMSLHAQSTQGNHTALVFGPERSGLENDDVAQCAALVTIPTDPANASLNIAQSVVVLAYEWFAFASEAQGDETLTNDKTAKKEHTPATISDIEGLHTQLAGHLDHKGFFTSAPEKRQTFLRTLRQTFARLGLTAQDVSTLRGVMRWLAEK